jgi:LPXTG-motif cell wall-anchored protein
VGQIDPNAPAPFSLTAIVDPNTAAGSYSITIQVFYRDDLQVDHLVNILIGLSVVSELPSTQTTPPSITEQLLSNQMLLLALGVVIILIIVGVYVRRRRKAQET